MITTFGRGAAAAREASVRHHSRAASPLHTGLRFPSMEDSGSSLRPRSLPLQRETDVIIAMVWLGSVGRRAAVIVAVGAH